MLQLYYVGLESTSFSVFYGILSQKSAQVCKTSIQNLLVIALLTCLHQVGPNLVIKRPARDACLCMGELLAPPALPAPPAPHFVFLITL